MIKSFSKRLVALLMAFVMAFSLTTIVSAVEPSDGLSAPASKTEVSALTNVVSINIGGTNAYYEKDNNTGDTIYIRALMANTKTEYDLKNASVTINLSNDVVVKLDGTTINGTGNTRTFTTDLMNKAHVLSIGNIDYVLAAGIQSGRVSIHSADLVGLGIVTMENTAMDVYGSNVQNPYMGNTYFVNRNANWTFINYFIAGILPTGTALSGVSTTYSLKTGASISGAGATNVTSGNYVFNFTSGDTITVANGSDSRIYHAKLAIEGQSVVVMENANGVRNYDIDLTEVMSSDYYAGTVAADVNDIVTAWDAYISEPHTFATGTSVMAILQAFDTWATQTENPETGEEYFTGTSDFGGGTYLSKLNNLSWNDCGSMAGYMYTDDSDGLYNEDVAGLDTQSGKSSIPMVGAADMTFTSSSRIVWFYTVDYGNWF